MCVRVHAGCCLCIHSSAEGPAVRTECPPPWLRSEPSMPGCASLAFHPPTFLILLSFVITLPIIHTPSCAHTHKHTYTNPHAEENGWHFQGHLRLCSKSSPPTCTHTNACKCTAGFWWTRAVAYPNNHLRGAHARRRARKQTTPHMQAQTRAYDHTLTGTCALFVHNPLHLFLSSRLTEACLPLIPHNTHSTGTRSLS